MDPVCLFHALLERHHRAGHLAVVHRADVEVEVLERLGAHAGGLGHAGRRPAQDTPAGLAHAVIEDRPRGSGVERHPIAGHVGVLAGVTAAADGDVGLHLLHAIQLEVAHQAGMLAVGRAQHLAVDPRVADFDDRVAPTARAACISSMENSSGTSIMSSSTRSPCFQEVEYSTSSLGQLCVARISHRES